MAYVVAPGRRRRRALEAAVRAHCETRLARFKQPSRVEVVDELPAHVTGKVRRAGCAAWSGGGRSASWSEPT